jgi:hypothetical protein
MGLNCSGTAGLYVDASIPIVGGSCTPQSTGTEMIVKPSWGTPYVGCALSNTTMHCQSGGGTGVCLPGPNPANAAKNCIYQMGTQTCPPGTQYTVATTIDTLLTDTRTCTPCACSSPTGKCAGGANFASNATCTTPTTEVLPLTCTQITSIPAASAYYADLAPATQMGPATCTPSGGPTGMVTADGPMTVCCMP